MFRQVHIETAGPTGRGCKITTHDGAEVHGVRSALISITPKEANTVQLEVYTTASVAARGQFVMIDPSTGEKKTVKRIEFVGGTTFAGTERPHSALAEHETFDVSAAPAST